MKMIAKLWKIVVKWWNRKKIKDRAEKIENALWGIRDCSKCGAFTINESGLCAKCDVLNPAFNQPEPSLPTHCPLCNRPVTPSKIDDRVAGCTHCKQIFLTEEAQKDPNIQRDMVHANAGITPKHTKMRPGSKWEQMVCGWWERSDKSMLWEDYWAELKLHEPNFRGMYGQAIGIMRDREIREARAFGEGYTCGKHGMSRAEFNRMRKERENSGE